MKYSVSVRTLCEFTAKSGDLDLRFTPAPSAQEGIAGHGIVTSRRPFPYQAEVSLAGDYKHLSVRGRADGYDPARNRRKSVRASGQGLPWRILPAGQGILRQAAASAKSRAFQPYAGQSSVARHCRRVSGLPLLSQPGSRALVRRDRGRLQPLFRSRCTAIRAGDRQSVAYRRPDR